MANKKLRNAKDVKNDEFYTQFSEIQKEINAYLEYDPLMYFEIKRFCCHVMTQNGQISQSFLPKILKGLV